MKKLMSNQKGFTIMELVVVIIILGILVAIALPRYFSLTAEAQLAACRANMKAIEAAVVMEYSDRLLQGLPDTMVNVVNDYNTNPAAFFSGNTAPREPSGGTYTVAAVGDNQVSVTCSLGHTY